MKREDVQKLILFINFIALVLIVLGILTGKYLIVMLVVGVIMLALSLFLSRKWKKMPKEQAF